MWRILLIQGANMIHLGNREPEIYGKTTASELDVMLHEHARRKGYELEIFYTNVEGEAINRIYHAVEEGVDGLVMNPAGFNYAGYALRDCVKGAVLPYVEVHMTNVEARGIKCLIAPVADGVIFGLGVHSYVLGLDAMLYLLSNSPAGALRTHGGRSGRE
ncbi:type II 3-dehydroquinate dehydratase [Paraburkholderia flagellata]|uniref:type II 3-dehydroquinate dehydratase n=1 Tax=Paraburkholderia flagellata TaxID=2883241 RepID=UPI001F309796|nr:type II 3-dehydroquinate dehydratase [Paraburkholderia flagellata]